MADDKEKEAREREQRERLAAQQQQQTREAEKARFPVRPPVEEAETRLTAPRAGEHGLKVASSSLINDMRTVLATGPTALSYAMSNNPNGPIMDITGNEGLVLNNLKEASDLMSEIKRVTDSADPNLAKVNG